MGQFGQRSGAGNSAGRRRRPGIAAVELALCLPFLFTLTLGAIETCNLIYVRTRMYSAAYEAARVATRPTTASALAASATSVTTQCGTLLTQLGVHGATVQLQVLDCVTSQSKTLDLANPQDLVTVSITAPLGQNSITSFVLSKSMTLSAQATLIVE